VEPLPGEGEEEDEEPGFGSRPGVVALSTGPESSATVEIEGRAGVREALDAWLGDAARAKTVHDPKLVELLLEPEEGIAGVRHAVRLYSYLLRPTTAKHDLEDVAVRHLSAAPMATAGEKAAWRGASSTTI
jgi:DNA polymerase I-like protein with 3'-5' exonuclease and polymerase domains